MFFGLGSGVGRSQARGIEASCAARFSLAISLQCGRVAVSSWWLPAVGSTADFALPMFQGYYR